MSGTVQGPLTDLERANYTSDSNLTKSIIYTRVDGTVTIDDSTPIDVNVVSPDPLPVNNATFPVIPTENVGYFVEYLTDSLGSENQNVDGSVTPVTFDWSPNPVFGTVLVFKAKLILIADNITDFFDYANRSPLANGVKIQTSQVGLGTFDYATVNSNVEFNQISTDSVAGGFEKKGNNTQDGQSLVLSFEPPIKANSDFSFINVIQDDLTGINYQKSTVFFRTT